MLSPSSVECARTHLPARSSCNFSTACRGSPNKVQSKRLSLTARGNLHDATLKMAQVTSPRLSRQRELCSSSKLMPVTTAQSTRDCQASKQLQRDRHTRSSASSLLTSTDQATPSSSSASTRASSPHSSGLAQAESRSDSASLVRRLEADIRAKDLRIEALEARVLELESGPDYAQYCVWNSWGSYRASLELEVEAAVTKSEALLQKMSALDVADEPEMQWAALMAAHEDCKDRLSQIEHLVQRRTEQLSSGDTELRLCRSIRGLCVGSQKTLPRRWILS